MRPETMLTRGLRFLGAAAIVLALTACTTLKDVAGVQGAEPSVSPRYAVQAAVLKVDPVIKEVTGLLASGLVPKPAADDIAQFGPAVEAAVGAYFDNAEACVAIDGALTTDTATGRACEGRALVRLYNAVDRSVLDWAAATGAKDAKAGQVVAAARLVIALVPRPASSGAFRNEPDMPLDQFQAMRAGIKADFEAMLAAAAKASGKAQ